MVNVNGKVVDMNQKQKDELLNKIKGLAEKGLRTLAICIQEDCGALNDYDGPKHKAHELLVDTNNYKELEKNPIIVGIVAL